MELQELCEFITKGTTPNSKYISKERNDDHIPFIKVYNLTNDGSLNFYHNPSYIPQGIHNIELKRSKTIPKDVLMNIVGPPLGKFALVPDTFNECNVNQAIVIFRAKEKLNPIYLLNILKFPPILHALLDQAIGIRQQNLNLEQCRKYKIPLPHLNFNNNLHSK